MKLLVASPLAYHPACGNGGGVICWSLLQGLIAAGHRVAFVAFVGDGEDAEKASSRLKAVCDEVHLHVMPTAGRMQSLRRRLHQWVGGPPVEAAAFADDGLRNRLLEVQQRFAPDLAMLQFPYMAQYVSALAGTPVLMDVQDLFFVSRLRAWSATRGRWARLKKMVAWLAWTRHERDAYGRCNLLMTLTDEDRAGLQALVPGVPAFTNSAAIEPRHAAHDSPASTPHRIAFGGNFAHPPNVDALRWLNAEIAPRLATRCPGVRIVVAGRGAAAALEGQLPHSSLDLLGFVDDFDGFVRSCHVFLAPLRQGGGVKVKVLEALACGRPVVSTPIGAEGIALTADDGLEIGRDVDELVEAVACLLTEPARARATGQRAAAFVAQSYGPASTVRRFEDAVAQLLPPPAPSVHRRAALSEQHA